MLARPGLKVETGPPSLAQGVGDSARHSGQRLDRVEFTQRRFRQDGSDGLLERIVVVGLHEAARESCREMLEGHDLKPVTPFPGRLQP